MSFEILAAPPGAPRDLFAKKYVIFVIHTTYFLKKFRRELCPASLVFSSPPPVFFCLLTGLATRDCFPTGLATPNPKLLRDF